MGSPRSVYTVRQLVAETRHLLEASYPDVWVEGEIADLAAPPSGHRYFSLKERDAVLRCVLFRSRGFQAACAPANGMRVLVRGRLSVYVNRGDMQFIVSYLEEAGEGALRRAFELLKRRLEAEGLFSAERKRPLPPLPRRIGVVTSDRGAAMHDVLATLARRYPLAQVVLYPVPVQGEQAAVEIAAMLELAGRRREVDLLLLVRGGGSLHDLQAYNEEIVARAIAACSLPVVSGIGHETDFTIADFVADRRAPTPTGAAEAATPDLMELKERVSGLGKRLVRQALSRLAATQQRLDMNTQRLGHPRRRLEHWHRHHRHLQRRLLLAARAAIAGKRLALERSTGLLGRHVPGAGLRGGQRRLDNLARRLQQGEERRLGILRERVAGLAARLQGVGPRNTLERGYAILTDRRDGRIIRGIRDVSPGDGITARLADGLLDCMVEDVLEET